MSKKQKPINTSTTEVEYIALSLATNETQWLQNLLVKMNIKVKNSTRVMEDNQPAIAIVNNYRNSSMIKYRAIQDYVKKALIQVEYIPTKNKTDALNKIISNSKNLNG